MIIKNTLSLSLFAIAAGAVSNSHSATRIADSNQSEFARPQQMVDIGGRRLNLYCSGSGPVTVVFDAPSGEAGWSWFAVQPAVAKQTRACVYDRAGLGFSDPSDRPGTSANAVDDLHQLLLKAAIAPPYLMVGNSYGGANVQLYAYRFPQQVTGLVLVEAQHEDESARLDAASKGKLKQMYAMQDQMEQACLAQAEQGFAPGSEMLANCTGGVQAMYGRQLAAAKLAVEMSPRHWRAARSENTHFEIGDAQLRAERRSFGDLPLMVLSRGVSPYAIPGKPQSALNKAMEAENQAIHQELAALSTRGKLRVVKGAAHVIQTDQPEAVVDAIAAVLSQIHNQQK